MTAPPEALIQDAYLALIQAELNTMVRTPKPTVYAWDDAPQEGADYVMVTVDRTVGEGAFTFGGVTTGIDQYDLIVRSVGRSHDACVVLLHRASVAVESKRAALPDGRYTTPARFEGQQQDPTVDEDDQSFIFASRAFTVTLARG
ncbi:hypothetical protein [Nocardioides sp.]|uniref:hypothetical protein n=1 Tax=Nocardioides sp. TaxID=35761 RepID=UPI003513BED7